MNTSTATTLPSTYALAERRRKEAQQAQDRLEQEARRPRKATQETVARRNILLDIGGSLLLMLSGGAVGVFAGEQLEQAAHAGDAAAAYTGGQDNATTSVKDRIRELDSVPLDQAIASVALLMQYFSTYIPPVAEAGGESVFSTFTRELALANETLVAQGIILTSLPTIGKLFESWQAAKLPDVPPSTVNQGDVSGAQTYLAALHTLLSSPSTP